MIDLLLNENGDLLFTGNDLVMGNSDAQHQEHLLLFQKGNLKEDPETGVGIENYLISSETDAMLREIRYQFERDGMNVTAIDYDEFQNQLAYDANYTGQ